VQPNGAEGEEVVEDIIPFPMMPSRGQRCAVTWNEYGKFEVKLMYSTTRKSFIVEAHSLGKYRGYPFDSLA
jgi:hypothetical protein